MQTILLGLTGEKRAGKDTFCRAAEDFLGREKVLIVSSGELLGESLDFWGIPRTRENLQNHYPYLAKDPAFGPNFLVRKVENVIKSNIGKFLFIIYHTVRVEEDREFIRKYDGKIVYVTADFEKRLKRAQGASEKIGESEVTREQFLEEEKKENERMIPVFGGEADYRIENNGTEDEFRTRVFKLLESLIS